MTDRGAIESIAKVLANLNGWDNPPDDPYEVERAQRILDRLAADGYSVVKAEWEHTETRTVHWRRRVACEKGPWEPVPEGSEDEQ